MITNVLIVFIGGGLGAILRYIITYICNKTLSLSIIGTLLVNLIGSFLIGYAFGFFISKPYLISSTMKLFITVGFLGGLTTFSTFNFEIFELIKNGKITMGLLYMIGSCLIGLSLTFIGYYFAVKN